MTEETDDVETDIETLKEIDNRKKFNKLRHLKKLARYFCCPYDINHTMPKEKLLNHISKCKPNKPPDMVDDLMQTHNTEQIF